MPRDSSLATPLPADEKSIKKYMQPLHSNSNINSHHNAVSPKSPLLHGLDDTRTALQSPPSEGRAANAKTYDPLFIGLEEAAARTQLKSIPPSPNITVPKQIDAPIFRALGDPKKNAETVPERYRLMAQNHGTHPREGAAVGCLDFGGSKSEVAEECLRILHHRNQEEAHVSQMSGFFQKLVGKSEDSE